MTYSSQLTIHCIVFHIKTLAEYAEMLKDFWKYTGVCPPFRLNNLNLFLSLTLLIATAGSLH